MQLYKCDVNFKPDNNNFIMLELGLSKEDEKYSLAAINKTDILYIDAADKTSMIDWLKSNVETVNKYSTWLDKCLLAFDFNQTVPNIKTQWCGVCVNELGELCEQLLRINWVDETVNITKFELSSFGQLFLIYYLVQCITCKEQYIYVSNANGVLHPLLLNTIIKSQSIKDTIWFISAIDANNVWSRQFDINIGCVIYEDKVLNKWIHDCSEPNKTLKKI